MSGITVGSQTLDDFNFDMQSILDAIPLWVIGLVVLALCGLVLFLLLRRRQIKPAPVTRSNMYLNVESLGQHGTPAGMRELQFYNIPVRLAAIVIAPVGRDRATPHHEDAEQLLESIVPGIDEVIRSHRPEIRVWPAQLSVQGFTQAFFNHVALPGQQGKGTPWCSLAGKFMTHGHAFVAGLVFRSEKANGVGQVAVRHEAQWLDMLRLPKNSD